MRILLILVCLFVYDSCWGFTQLEVKEVIDVYRKPRRKFRPFAQLKPGMIAQIIKNNSTIYYKVRFSFNGRKVFGYIKKDDVFESEIQREGRSLNSKAVGVYVLPDLMYQPSHTIETQVGSGYEVQAASSLGSVIGVSFVFPVNDPFLIEIFGQYKMSAFKKTFRDKDSGLGMETTSEIHQSFVGGGFLIKYRFDKSILGGGLEFDSGQSVDIKTLSGTPVETNESSRPLFIQPVITWEKPLYLGSWMSFIRLRSGVVVNSKPVLATFALGLSLGFSL